MSLRFPSAWVVLVATALLLACTHDEIEQLPVPEDSGRGHFDFRVLVEGKEYAPIDTSGKELSVFVPLGTDLTALVTRFNEEEFSVTVNEVPQESGVSTQDFRNFRKGVAYRIESRSGAAKEYIVRVIDTQLPVVSVTTDTPGAIANREDWRRAVIRIRNTDGSIRNLGGTGIRGRGNWTWEKYPKKPYALKLDSRQEVLGMPAHRRWVLLAQYRGFIGNPLTFEATRRAPALGWAPRGCFVELVLNGKFQGLYYLCEHIKIDENRVDIAELDSTDVHYPEVSGGYLLEYDELYDEAYKFKSSGFRLPVQLKSPNDHVPDAQFNYIKGFVNDMEAEILKIGTGQESHYGDYLDIDSFAEYWLVLETIGNYEAWKPRSVKMYKGRDGVDSPPGTVCRLKAGPLWDQELFLVDKEFNSKDMYYFKYLFKDPAFVAAVKEHWVTYKSNILGNGTYDSLLDYLDGIVSQIRKSANRDISYWGNGYFTLNGEVGPVRGGFLSKIRWMDEQIEQL